MTLQKDGPLRQSRMVCRRCDDLDIFSLHKVELNKDVSAFAHSKILLLTLSSLDSSQSYPPEVQRHMDLFRALVPALGHYSQLSVLLLYKLDAIGFTENTIYYYMYFERTDFGRRVCVIGSKKKTKCSAQQSHGIVKGKSERPALLSSVTYWLIILTNRVSEVIKTTVKEDKK
ncbi:hypothetical protein E2I00_001081 [Balaenoptera physalus]|uniref:Uncharacterized protein n=1 Tax=Balaenoptera physalus TaxID=9770 RepID=A0A6A1Q636_BALPH|nr:hypothetical protein E2I00_001081 [Balaenoptera physalus]